jgi:antitoxin PrlF
MARTTLRSRGQLTLPEAVRSAAHLEEGDLVDAEVTPDGILLRPLKVVDSTQAWFWTSEWRAGEGEAEADKAAGRAESFQSGKEFLAALRKRSRATRRPPR